MGKSANVTTRVDVCNLETAKESTSVYFYLYSIYSLSITLNLRNIFLIYIMELQLNKANTSDKETSFLGLNIKVIGSVFIPAFTTNAMTRISYHQFPLGEW